MKIIQINYTQLNLKRYHFNKNAQIAKMYGLK